jgi:hypothetical protein
VSTDINDYLSLITSEHRGKPRFAAMVAMMCQTSVDQQINTAAMTRAFDLDNAAGVQLDTLGLFIGVTRNVQDIPISGGGMLTVLNDTYYRLVLRAWIIADQWDGTIPDAYAFWAALLPGHTIQILDNQDMTMRVTLMDTGDPVVNGLFVAGLLPLKPAGVAVTYDIG